MAIAITLKQYLDDRHVPYEVMIHDRTSTARETARRCEIPSSCLAKAVLMRDDRGYIVAVLPASCQVDRKRLEAFLNRPVEMASEEEAARLFRDCERGALPAIGEAYGIDTVVDERLDSVPEVWIEGGDHERLLHLDGPHFRELMAGARHARISRT